MSSPRVGAVCLCGRHAFSKQPALEIRLVEGLGVEGDARSGAAVQHRFDKRRHPGRRNLRQVHLMQGELFAELASAGFAVGPGDLGENITTEGIALLSLPEDTELRLGDAAAVRLTGLRDPCLLLDKFQPGLMGAVTTRAPDGAPAPKAGVMSIVVRGGVVRPGDSITAILPATPHMAMHTV